MYTYQGVGGSVSGLCGHTLRLGVCVLFISFLFIFFALAPFGFSSRGEGGETSGH